MALGIDNTCDFWGTIKGHVFIAWSWVQIHRFYTFYQFTELTINLQKMGISRFNGYELIWIRKASTLMLPLNVSFIWNWACNSRTEVTRKWTKQYKISSNLVDINNQIRFGGWCIEGEIAVCVVHRNWSWRVMVLINDSGRLYTEIIFTD